MRESNSIFKIFSICCFIVFMTTACATRNMSINEDMNSAPEVKFSEFKTIELMDIQITSEYASEPANIKAKNKIQEILNMKLSSVIKGWNSIDSSEKNGTLLIEPTIEKIKFIGGAARFWVGALAGSSAVVMKVVYREQETGKVIASPVFYQHANSFTGGWTFGGADNAMLDRIAELVAKYTIDNYDKLVGGKTGKPKSE